MRKEGPRDATHHGKVTLKKVAELINPKFPDPYTITLPSTLGYTTSSMHTPEEKIKSFHLSEPKS